MYDTHESEWAVRERLLGAAEERLRAAPSPRAIVDVLRSMTQAIVDADGVSLARRCGSFCFFLDDDAVAAEWKGQRFPAANCGSTCCTSDGASTVIEDVDVDPRKPQELYRRALVRSLIMAQVGRQAPGTVVVVYWSRPRCHPREDVIAVERLAHAAGLALGKMESAQLDALLK